MPLPSSQYPTLNLRCWLAEPLSSHLEEEDLSFAALCVVCLPSENRISLAPGQPGETKANSPLYAKCQRRQSPVLCRPEEGIGFPGARVGGSHEPPSMGAGNFQLILLPGQQALLTEALSAQPNPVVGNIKKRILAIASRALVGWPVSSHLVETL